jgi:hypothetical protein
VADELPTVYVRAVVNVGHLRRGDEGDVELTPTIERMVRSGYLQILGHSPAAAPSPAVEPAPVANPARTRRKAVGDGGGGTGGDPA